MVYRVIHKQARSARWGLTLTQQQFTLAYCIGMGSEWETPLMMPYDWHMENGCLDETTTLTGAIHLLEP